MSVRLTATDRRAGILEAAAVEFGEAGYEGATTDAIARRAGISQPYVIRLFGSKKQLFVEVVRRCYETVGDMFEAACEGDTPDERLCAMGATYAPRLDDPRVLKLQLHAYAAAADDEEIRQAVAEGYLGLWARVGELSGASQEELREYFSHGLLITVAAALRLPMEYFPQPE
jgi:AcrR family transcriptional regulator